MALKAVLVSDVPSLDQVSENAAALALFTQCEGDHILRQDHHEAGNYKNGFKFPGKFVVMGHRGSGMNIMQSPDPRMKSIKENSILSFNAAAKLPISFIEFDVQVTKDGCPIVFHDNFVLTEGEDGEMAQKRVTELTLHEFLSYGPQKEDGKVGKPLFRKTKDGRIFEWKVEEDDHLCTLQEVFQKVDDRVGFNIELKFDDQLVYKEEELTHVLQVTSKVVFEHAKNRPIMFSSFQPDAAQMMRKLQATYPVFFLTNGGSEIYSDMRRNSLDEATKVCLEGALQGIVSEVKAIFRNPGAVSRIKESNLSLVTYGQLNNGPEVVYAQYLMGVDGVIVDLVQEITMSVSGFTDPAKKPEELSLILEEAMQFIAKTQFPTDELPFLQNLIPQLIQARTELLQICIP